MPFLRFALISLLVPTSCLSSPEDIAGKLDFGIFDWIHSSEGGYYNPKQVFRHQYPEDSNSLVGVFAKERIEEGEILCKVPWDRILFDTDECGTATLLAQAMREGEESEFAPYALYCDAQRRGQLPTAWSKAGQELLEIVQGYSDDDEPSIPPHNTLGIADEWYTDCAEWGSYIYDEKWIHAGLLAHQRADDYIMIPAYDMYNHRNGNWTNAKTYWKHGEPHITKAFRTIEAGEQIYISYDKCPECGGRAKPGYYGTARKKVLNTEEFLISAYGKLYTLFSHLFSVFCHLFHIEFLRDYGFVEVMPQRWNFWNGKMVFDMDEPETGKYELEWHFKPKSNQLNKAVTWLEKEISRLTEWKESMKNDEKIKSRVGDLVSPEELFVIHAFCDANLLAMIQALQSLVGADRNEEL